MATTRPDPGRNPLRAAVAEHLSNLGYGPKTAGRAADNFLGIVHGLDRADAFIPGTAKAALESSVKRAVHDPTASGKALKEAVGAYLRRRDLLRGNRALLASLSPTLAESLADGRMLAGDRK